MVVYPQFETPEVCDCASVVVVSLTTLMMPMWSAPHRTKFGVLALIAACSLSSVAHAELGEDTRRAAARTLGQEGLDAYERADWNVALDRFLRAYKLHPVPTLALWSGRTLAKMGKLVAASERLLEASRLDVSDSQEVVQRAAQRDAKEERDALISRIPMLRLETKSLSLDGAKLRVDGSEMPLAAIGTLLPVDPGEHRVTIETRAGTAVASANLEEGTLTTIVLQLENATTPAVPRRAEGQKRADFAPGIGAAGTDEPLLSTTEWLALGGAVAGISTWAVGGLLALNKRGQLQDRCVDKVCPRAFEDDLRGYRTYRTVSTIGFALGAVSTASFGVLLLTRPSKQARDTTSGTLRGWVGYQSLGISWEQ